MSPKVIKVLGSILPVVSFGVSMLGNWIEKKELNAKIAKEVAKAVKNHK